MKNSFYLTLFEKDAIKINMNNLWKSILIWLVLYPKKLKKRKMKKLFKTMIAVVAIGSLFLASCGKYEEGPGFTVRTAKARASGDWKLTSLTVNGTDYTSSLGGTITMTVDKDGTYKTTYSSTAGTNETTGTWTFNDDKTTISFTESGSSSTADVYTILELKSKEMKLQQVDAGFTTITTYTAQ